MIENKCITKKQIEYIKNVFNFLHNTKCCIYEHEVIYLLEYLMGDDAYNPIDRVELLLLTDELSEYVEKEDFNTFLGALLSEMLNRYNLIREREENE